MGHTSRGLLTVFVRCICVSRQGLAGLVWKSLGSEGCPLCMHFSCLSSFSAGVRALNQVNQVPIPLLLCWRLLTNIVTWQIFCVHVRTHTHSYFIGIHSSDHPFTTTWQNCWQLFIGSRNRTGHSTWANWVWSISRAGGGSFCPQDTAQIVV